MACQRFGPVFCHANTRFDRNLQDSLGGPEGYLRYLQIQALEETKASLIYVPTEAGLPVGVRTRIVLNRLASRMFGPAPSVAEAERALERKAEAGISSDWEAAAASVNLGGPICQHRPKSKIVRDVSAVVDRLLGVQTPASRRSGWRPRRAA